MSLALIVLMAIGAGGSGRLDPQAYGVTGIMALVPVFIHRRAVNGVSSITVGP